MSPRSLLVTAALAVATATMPGGAAELPGGATANGVVGAASPAKAAGGGALSEALQKDLLASKYIYMSSQRKDGSWSKPAEIWFMYHDGAVWVGTPPTSWRAKRIKAGRSNAKIAVGAPTGPSFEAVGEIVKNPAVNQVLFETFAKKYPDGWPQHEPRFRSGLEDGSRVLIKYTPKATKS